MLPYQAPTFADNTAELIAKFKAEGGQVTRKESRRKARPVLKGAFISERVRSY